MKIRVGRGDRHKPRPQLRHAQAHDRGRPHRPRRRDAQRPRARRRQLPARPRRAAADRPRRPPDRRHLAVPVPQRLLAPRAGDDGRDRRGGRRALGHQSQGRGDAAVPAARRRIPRPGCSPTGTRADGPARAVRLRSSAPRAGLQGHPDPDGRPGLRAIYGVAANATPRATRASATTTSRPSARRCRSRRTGTPARTCVTCRPSSRRCETSSVPSCRCCTTATTG